MKARSEYRILVVDDQKSMRGLATYFLKQIEFQDIDEAENAREALMKMQGKRYDLLLLDWNMDGMSGIDLLRAIRSVPELNQIKIIMATSERSVDKMDEATTNGADHYVVKPYELRDLEVRVKKVLACSAGQTNHDFLTSPPRYCASRGIQSKAIGVISPEEF